MSDTGDLFGTIYDAWPEDKPGLKEAWREFHKNNPHVYEMYKRFTFQVIGVGFQHYSSDAICHRIRWHTKIETQSVDEFKINDHHTAYYSRLFMANFPEHNGFFRTRSTKSA